MKDIGAVEVEEHVRHPRMFHAFQQFVNRPFYLQFIQVMELCYGLEGEHLALLFNLKDSCRLVHR